MTSLVVKIAQIGNLFQDIALLAVRIILAYGFYNPAISKWQNIEHVAQWFSSMGYPFPTLSTYLAATAEMAGMILLPFGLLTRLVSIPLMVVMVVAITTVHWGNGFAASDNGFEIPLYYLIMLLVLFAFGAGRISVDHLMGEARS